jgi:4-amino-4-deoxy-L-arabinose transferase-like glycosyltransferase
MAIGIANAFVWALLTPTFQIPDETVHAGYAQYVAETGKIPKPRSPFFHPSQDEEIAFSDIPWSLTGVPNWTAENNRALHTALSQPGLGRVSEGASGYISANPPLYYYLEAVPYRLAASGNFLDRLYAMRFFSALLAGLTTGFVFLFLRELVPRTPWLWTLGALAVAFQPVFGFIAGGVDNDNLVWVASAALFWLLARAFRRGLTVPRALGIGAALSVGLLTKGTMYGLVPGAILGLVLLAWRGRGSGGIRAGAVGVATSLIPFGVWLAINHAVLDRSGSTTTGGFTATAHTSLSGQLSYLWQFYLPRLPFMHHHWFTGYPRYPLWQTFFEGFVGRFGWFSFGFPLWVNIVGLVVVVVAAGFAVAALVRLRPTIRRRLPEAVVYLTLAVGLFLLVGVAGYRFRLGFGTNFEQTRYLFGLLPLYALLVVLAARGAGRRFAPVAGALLLCGAIADSVFSQLLTISHYFA